MGENKDAVGNKKEINAVLSPILSKLEGVKGSLLTLIGKQEHEQLTWPSVLSSFSSFSGHTSNLMKQLSGEKLPPLLNVILPLMVSSDKDYELERQTEGRVPMMHHEVVPNYLRTKLSLELEAKQKEKWDAAKKEGVSSTEQINQFNQILSSALERVNSFKEELEERKNRTDMVQGTYDDSKKLLVAAYLHGMEIPQISMIRRTYLSGGRMQAPSRNVAMRAAIRSDQRVAPYPMTSPHKPR